MSKKTVIENGWALFLDRDGVINKRIPDDYVKNPDAFELLAVYFNPIVVVTNQQGIGRGIMSTEQLELVHNKMLNEVSKKGGRIDAVFFSPDIRNSNSFTRKPSVGLGLKARKQFPSIDFKKSIMAGDTFTDILFGHRLGMLTALIGMDKDVANKSADILDYSFPDLLAFAEFVKINFYVKD
jgi:histidinol-phosphate phosphatase family protein